MEQAQGGATVKDPGDPDFWIHVAQSHPLHVLSDQGMDLMEGVVLKGLEVLLQQDEQVHGAVSQGLPPGLGGRRVDIVGNAAPVWISPCRRNKVSTARAILPVGEVDIRRA